MTNRLSNDWFSSESVAGQVWNGLSGGCWLAEGYQASQSVFLPLQGSCAAESRPDSQVICPDYCPFRSGSPGWWPDWYRAVADTALRKRVGHRNTSTCQYCYLPVRSLDPALADDWICCYACYFRLLWISIWHFGFFVLINLFLFFNKAWTEYCKVYTSFAFSIRESGSGVTAFCNTGKV